MFGKKETAKDNPVRKFVIVHHRDISDTALLDDSLDHDTESVASGDISEEGLPRRSSSMPVNDESGSMTKLRVKNITLTQMEMDTERDGNIGKRDTVIHSSKPPLASQASNKSIDATPRQSQDSIASDVAELPSPSLQMLRMQFRKKGSYATGIEALPISIEDLIQGNQESPSVQNTSMLRSNRSSQLDVTDQVHAMKVRSRRSSQPEQPGSPASPRSSAPDIASPPTSAIPVRRAETLSPPSIPAREASSASDPSESDGRSRFNSTGNQSIRSRAESSDGETARVRSDEVEAEPTHAAIPRSEMRQGVKVITKKALQKRSSLVEAIGEHSKDHAGTSKAPHYTESSI
jgi:hypothetical protein